MKFSIVIPVYNESKNLPLLISQIYKVLENHTFELIIIDDNSSDGTFEVLNKIKKKNFRFFIRKKKINFSKLIFFCLKK